MYRHRLGKITLIATLARQASPFLGALSLLTVAMPVFAASPPDGSALFGQKCAGCHTIGKGNLVGPDLVPSSSWKGSALSTAVKRMQQKTGPLSDGEVDALVNYLKTAGSQVITPGSSGQSVPASPQTPASAPTIKPEATAMPGATAGAPVAEQPPANLGSEVVGRKLFDGEVALANGGLSCLSCHQAQGNGGTIAPDLSAIAAKLPVAALESVCASTPFKVMKDVYANHPVTKQEAIDLAAYFESINKAKPSRHRDAPVGLVGTAGAMLMMGLIAWGYRNRNSSVRDKLKRRR